MIKLRIIARIDVDKNFFVDFLFTMFLLKQQNIIVQIEFIGQIFNNIVYENIVRCSTLFGLKENVSFTRRSIPIKDIHADSGDYFINFSVGDFVGYSSIECLKRNFRTIFFNVDPTHPTTKGRISFVDGPEEFSELLKKIHINRDKTNNFIKEENEKVLETFYLNDSERQLLKNILMN